MNMSNIIPFPVQELKRSQIEKLAKQVSEEDLLAKKKGYVEKQCEWYSHKLLVSLHKQGFDVDDEQFLEDFVFVMESFKSCLSRNLGIEHPLQQIQHKLHELLEENDS